MGWRGYGGLRIEVEFGSKGDVLAGVMRALSVVEMLSSMLARERRRKSRSMRVSKQNCGVRGGVGVGLDMMGLGLPGDRECRCCGEEEAGGRLRAKEDEESEGGEVQNHASLI